MEDCKQTVSTQFATVPVQTGCKWPTPRTFNGEKYYGTDDVAKIIGVKRQTVSYWHNKGYFTADDRAHDGRYLYTVEHVEQLKSVYRPDWNQPAYLTHVDDNDAHAQVDTPADQTPEPVTQAATRDDKTNDDALNARIIDDIKRAQKNLQNLPADDRRGLDEETLRHFGFGFSDKWRHPKMPGTMPTARFIVPLGDGTAAYNAILTPTERQRIKPLCDNTDKPPKWTEKSLTAGSKQVFNPRDLTYPIVVVGEGEIDMASLWQAVQRGKIIDAGGDGTSCGFIALGGTGGASTDLINRLKALPTKPKVAVLFDDDQAKPKPGQTKTTAEDLIQKLWGIGVVAVKVFFETVLTPDEKDKLGDKKPDANEILQQFGDDKLYRIFARVVKQAKADFPKAEFEMQQFKAARAQAESERSCRPHEASPDIDALITRIKDEVTISRLVDKGYLQHSARGQAHPKGYCCPWCGSGNGTHETGALEIFDSNTNPHVACYVCHKGGDVIKTFAQVKNLPTSGSEFFDTLKAIADEFGVAYDPKIFEHNAAQKFKTGNEVVDVWQQANGIIDKQLYLEICAAEKFIQELTADKITATVASSKATTRKVALCTFYDFELTAAQNFWLKLDDAINNAAAQIKESTAAGGEFVALPDDTRALAHLNAKDVRKAVDREVKAIQKAHEQFQVKVKADEAKAKRKHAHGQKLRQLDELSKQSQSAARDAKIIKAIRDICAWNRDNHGKPTTIKATQENLDLIFDNDPNLSRLIGKDQFQGVNVFLKRAPWHDIDRTGDTWSDDDDAQLRVYLRQNYAEFTGKQLIDDTVISVAGKNAFNAVKQFLAELPRWDGVNRAETLLVKFLHADDTEYTRTVTMNWLLGALARVFHPGVEFAYCLVLQGAQRIGKSRLAQMLGGKLGVNPNGQNWHVALKDSVDDSHATDALLKGWIIEIEEFSASRKADVNDLKAFISATDDTRRFAYDRHPSTRLRHVAFVATCNDQQFLRDQTGNARFIVVKCSQKKFEQGEEMTPEYIRQVWAEALIKYNELFKDATREYVGKKLLLPRDVQIQAEEIAGHFTQDDDVANELRGYLDTKIPPQIIWKVLTKDERRNFITDGKLYVGGGKCEIERRIKSRNFDKSTIERDVDDMHIMLTAAKNNDMLYRPCGGTDDKNPSAIYIFGTEFRRHICVSEVLNEAFAKGDKRANGYRITEVLSSLDGWTAGARLQKADPQYPDQRKPFYRDAEPENEPTNDDTDNDIVGAQIVENPPF